MVAEWRGRLAAAAVTVLFAGTAAAMPADPSSPPVASELSALMREGSLQAIAARDPDDASRFVAALFFPGVQLLVVSGTPTAPSAALAELEASQYAAVYSTLHSAVVPDSKLFVQDMNADGLRARVKDVADIVYDRVAHQMIFDGAPGKHRLTDEQYHAQFADADARYARMLRVLVNAVRALRAPTTP